MPDFKQLDVWNLAIEIVTDVYLITSQLPDSEKFGLSAQMRRAAVSIPSNISEGYARNSRREYVQFLGIASGSLAELQTQFIICENLGHLTADSALTAKLNRCAAMLINLMKSLRAKHS